MFVYSCVYQLGSFACFFLPLLMPFALFSLGVLIGCFVQFSIVLSVATKCSLRKSGSQTNRLPRVTVTEK